MGFLIIIFTRLLFIACMVFIIGYVFGPFAGKPVLRTITRVAAILVVILFIVTNVIAIRAFRAEGTQSCSDEDYRRGKDTREASYRQEARPFSREGEQRNNSGY